MRRAPVVLPLAALLLAACGSEPPPKAPEPAPEPVHEVKPQLKMRTELGTVDPGAVTRAFHGLLDKFSACQAQGQSDVPMLAGSVKFFLRIGEDGSARWSYLEQSDLGDREMEKCLLDAVTAARWPRPDGGDAEARYTMEFPVDGRPATDWSSDKVAAALGRSGEAIDRCKEGASGKLEATMYVAPGGKVIAAGVAASSRDAAEKADCVAGVLAKLKGLPSPGSWPAKVSFGL